MCTSCKAGVLDLQLAVCQKKECAKLHERRQAALAEHRRKYELLHPNVSQVQSHILPNPALSDYRLVKDYSKNPYPLRNNTIPNETTIGVHELQSLCLMVPGPRWLSTWELCDFLMDNGFLFLFHDPQEWGH